MRNYSVKKVHTLSLCLNLSNKLTSFVIRELWISSICEELLLGEMRWLYFMKKYFHRWKLDRKLNEYNWLQIITRSKSKHVNIVIKIFMFAIQSIIQQKTTIEITKIIEENLNTVK